MTEVVATNETILVVGGGISGMTAALEAAETGKQVVLVEKRPYLGGRVSQLYKYFPKLCFPTCGLEINQRRAKMNPNLRVLTMAEVTDIKGEPGSYTASVKLSPRYINESCTACGNCEKAVTAEFDDEYNYGLGKRKGAYLPYRMAHPQRYVLDPAIIGTDDARKAKDACKYDAIDLDMAEETIDFPCGAVIWATGWRPYDAAKIQPYGYDRIANVITSVEFERMADLMGPTGGKLVRPSDGKEAKKVAFIQCAPAPVTATICCTARGSAAWPPSSSAPTSAMPTGKTPPSASTTSTSAPSTASRTSTKKSKASSRSSSSSPSPPPWWRTRTATRWSTGWTPRATNASRTSMTWWSWLSAWSRPWTRTISRWTSGSTARALSRPDPRARTVRAGSSPPAVHPTPST